MFTSSLFLKYFVLKITFNLPDPEAYRVRENRGPVKVRVVVITNGIIIPDVTELKIHQNIDVMNYMSSQL